MAESQGALPAAQVLTKEESAEGTKTAFQKNKALFYSLRILRELVWCQTAMSDVCVTSIAQHQHQK